MPAIEVRVDKQISSRTGQVVLTRYAQDACTLLIAPIHRLKQSAKLRIVSGERR